MNSLSGKEKDWSCLLINAQVGGRNKQMRKSRYCEQHRQSSIDGTVSWEGGQCLLVIEVCIIIVGLCFGHFKAKKGLCCHI